MQEKPPFGTYFDIFPNVWEAHPLHTLILPSGTPLTSARQELSYPHSLGSGILEGCKLFIKIMGTTVLYR